MKAWNTGAVLYANLEMGTAGSGEASRAAEQLAAVQQAYRSAVAGGYAINGQYIDSSTAGFDLFDYAPGALKTTRHPPVFDAAGRPVQPRTPFLRRVLCQRPLLTP